MSEFDRDIRLYIEERIDKILEGEISEFGAKQMLTDLGIEPNLETSLSFLAGGLFTRAIAMSASKYGKFREKDVDGAAELLSRRIMEMRQYYLQTRNL